MEQVQRSFNFTVTPANRPINDAASAESLKTGNESIILEKSVCRLLDDYVRRYTDDESIIELKGKLIRYIRSI